MLGVFGDSKAVNYVRNELLAVWDGLDKDDRPARDSFIEMAYQVLPKEAFAYALETLETMDQLDERAIDWEQYKQAPAGPCELFFRILCSTKDSSQFKNALPYIVSCVRRGLCSIKSYKTAIEQVLGFDENSINAGLRDEMLLLERFTRELEMANSPNCAGFLLRLAKKYLSTSIEKFRKGEGLVFEFLRSDVPDIEAVKNLRAKSIRTLCMLLHSKEWAAEASDVILRCIGLGLNPEKLRGPARERKKGIRPQGIP